MHTIFALILISLTAFAHGQVYKWVDAQGKIQFSDQPQPGTRSQLIKVKPSTGIGQQSAPAKQESLAEKEAAMKQRRMDRAESEAKEEEKAKLAAEKDAYCSQLKGQLLGAKRAAVLANYDENGQENIMSADARKAEIEKYEQRIQKDCSE